MDNKGLRIILKKTRYTISTFVEELDNQIIKFINIYGYDPKYISLPNEAIEVMQRISNKFVNSDIQTFKGIIIKMQNEKYIEKDEVIVEQE